MDALVRTYLDRIGLRGPVKADLDTLRAVQRRALETIPFENLDILRGIPLRFGTEELADKVLTRRRGGVCYEQNFLLEEVLRRLGMDTALLSGYVIGGSQLAFSHALVMVRLPEGRYIADVGFGGRGTALTPLALDTGEWQSDGRSRFRLRREGEGYLLEREKGDGTAAGVYHFSDVPRRREEFRETCDTLCASPQCKFTHMLVCYRESSAGLLALRDGAFSVERPGCPPEITPVNSPEERDRLLAERFGLPPLGPDWRPRW